MIRYWSALALSFAVAISLGARGVPEFSFADSSGVMHTRAEWSGKRAIVLFFLTTDCPLSNNYVPELNRLNSDYEAKGVLFYGVQGDATIGLAEVRKHVQDFGYRFPYLLDPSESLAALTGATTTPETAVLSPTGDILYLGRIDNRVEDFGKARVKITEFDLRNALDAVLAGKPVARARTRAIGCAITRRD